MLSKTVVRCRSRLGRSGFVLVVCYALSYGVVSFQPADNMKSLVRVLCRACEWRNLTRPGIQPMITEVMGRTTISGVLRRLAETDLMLQSLGLFKFN